MTVKIKSFGTSMHTRKTKRPNQHARRSAFAKWVKNRERRHGGKS